MTIFQTPIRWQNQLIPSKNNLARSCVDRIANHVESGGWVNGLQSRILTVSIPLIFSIGTAQSGVKFACHLGLAFSGQSHQLKQSTIELIKMIGAVVLSVVLFVPATIFSSAYRMTDQLFELEIQSKQVSVPAFNGCEKSLNRFGDFIHPKHSVTLQFKKEAIKHPLALLRQLNAKDSLTYDRLVIDSLESLSFVQDNAELFKQASVVVVKDIQVDSTDWLTGKFDGVACFDFRGSLVNCNIKELEKKYIVVTDDSCNFVRHFNELCNLDLKHDSKTNNPAAKLIKRIDLSKKNYGDEDIREISGNLKQLFPRMMNLVLDENMTLTSQIFVDLAPLKLNAISFKSCPEIGKDVDAFKRNLRLLASNQLRYLIFDELSEACINEVNEIKKSNTQLKVVYFKAAKKRARSGSVSRRRPATLA